MELRRWLWIPVLLQSLIWAVLFVFAFFGFVETFAHAPGTWWNAHGPDYWLLLVGGLLCLPAFHGVVWLAGQADTLVRGHDGSTSGVRSLLRRSLDHAGSLLVWGLWLGSLAGLAGGFTVERPETEIPAALFSFAPVELCLWALACGVAPLTVLAVVDQMKGRDPERGVLAMLLHLACYVWFYIAADGRNANPADDAWMIAVLTTVSAVPMAWLMSLHVPDAPEPGKPR